MKHLSPILKTVAVVLGVCFVLNLLAASSPGITKYFGFGQQSN